MWHEGNGCCTLSTWSFEMTWNSKHAHLTPLVGNHLVSNAPTAPCAFVWMPPAMPWVIKYALLTLQKPSSRLSINPRLVILFNLLSQLLLLSSTANTANVKPSLITRCTTKMFLPRWSDGTQLLSRIHLAYC